MGLYDIIVEAIKKYLVHLLVMRYPIFNSSVYYRNPDYIKCSYELVPQK